MCIGLDAVRLHRLGFHGEGMAIGHLDSGIDANHPAIEHADITFRYIEKDGLSGEAADPFDRSGHGTTTACLIAGAHGPSAFTGVVPRARLYSAGVIEQGQIISRIVMGLDWVLDQPISVLNMSLGIPRDTPIFRTLIRACVQRDILVVLPSGNKGAGNAYCPGNYPEALTVGAIGADGRVPKFSGSSYDVESGDCIKPEIVAPGVGIKIPDKTGLQQHQNGSSLASAYVSGIALALRQAVPEAPAEAVAEALTQTCQPLQSDQTHRSRYGALSPIAALEYLRDQDCQTPPDRPGKFSHKRYVDPRLLDRLEDVTSEHPLDVVVEFCEQRACAQEIESLQSKYQASDGFKFKAIKHAPMLILRAPANAIRDLMSHPDMRLASAGDVDKLEFLQPIGQ